MTSYEVKALSDRYAIGIKEKSTEELEQRSATIQAELDKMSNISHFSTEDFNKVSHLLAELRPIRFELYARNNNSSNKTSPSTSL